LKDISTLVEDIYAVLDERTEHNVDEANVEAAGELFKQVLRTRFAARQAKRGEEVLRFSSLGKKPRQLWYAANMPEKAEVLSPQTSFKFLYGDCIEILLLFLAKEAGHEVTHEQYEVECDGVKGHTDCVIDGIPVDAKSASPYSFGKFKDGSFVFDDPFGYIPQISGYAHALEEEAKASEQARETAYTDRAAFLVADKVHGSITFAEVDEYTLRGNPPGPKIAGLREVISSGTPPSRCYSDEPEGKSGNRKLGVGCSYCAFKDECWKDSNGGRGLRKFYYSRGPVWLSAVSREPNVNEA
jgi:hypothetical protein